MKNVGSDEFKPLEGGVSYTPPCIPTFLDNVAKYLKTNKQTKSFRMEGNGMAPMGKGML